MQGGAPVVEGSGLVRWGSCRMEDRLLGKFHAFSGSVHAGDCGSAHCCG